MQEVTSYGEAFPNAAGREYGEPAKPTILLVEDEQTLRELISEVLEYAGYEVLPCSHPNEGIEVSRRRAGSIDLLLTDLVLPGMNGREMSRRILERLPKLRVVYMSGYCEPMVMEGEQRDADFNYLQKPFSVRTLTKKLASVLAQQVQ